MSPYLTEDDHRKYLEFYLALSDRFPSIKSEAILKAASTHAAQTLEVVKDIGYEGLYQEFKPLYKEAGFIE